MQFVEGLSDRQAAEAVRARIDWKYALSLELTDPGGDASVLCELRARLVDGDAGPLLLEAMLSRLKERGLLKARGQQRIDSTHVLAAIRTLNRLESVGETLRAAPNGVATVAPDWLTGIAAPEWFERYAIRVEEYRLPKGEVARAALGEQIGTDGHALLAAIDAPAAPAWLREPPAAQTLRQAWVHQFLSEDDVVRWRKAADLPPVSIGFDSPYDTDARYRSKRSTTWTGYKVHVTETCDTDAPHLIVHVETTPAPVTDSDLTAPIQQAQVDKGLAPATHLADAGYVDADLLVTSQTQHGIELLGPVRPDVSWPAKAGQGFDLAAFVVDWESKKVICPTGQTSVDWTPARDHWGNDTIHVGFHRPTCDACSSRPLCARAKTDPREITLRPRPLHEALQTIRARQETKAWRSRYGQRAGGRGHFVPGGARVRPASMSLYRVGQDPTSTCVYCHRHECRTGGRLADRTSLGQNPTIRLRFLGTPGRSGLGFPASNSPAVSVVRQTPPRAAETAGADLAKVQAWLGHADVATTRLYDKRNHRPEDSPTFRVEY